MLIQFICPGHRRVFAIGSTTNTYIGTAGPLASWTTKGGMSPSKLRPVPKLLDDMQELGDDWCGAGGRQGPGLPSGWFQGMVLS